MLELTRNPDVYHGKNKKSNFFEGWYFKLVQPKTGNTFCFIPGIFISKQEEQSHSFIQILKGNENSFKYLKYEKSDFIASSDKFNVKVGESTFSIDEINININQQDEKIAGRLVFDRVIKWPDSVVNPGSMGFYNYLDFMQCYSQVCAIDGYVKGKLDINGEIVDFTGGKVYIEKNWGKEFPYSYIWAQGNSFEREECSITCSIGHIPLPFPMKSFTGFLIGLNVKDKFYKFTSLNNSTLSIKEEKEKIIIKTQNRDYYLKVEALYKKGSFMDLYAPYGGEMVQTARETLQGEIFINLYDKKVGCDTVKTECKSAGVEFTDNYLDLIEIIERK